MVANRLIMEQVAPGDREFDSHYADTWEKLYPDMAMPPKETFLQQLWASTRRVLESGELAYVTANTRVLFVMTRMARYHAVKAIRSGTGTMDELHDAMAADLRNMGFQKLVGNLDASINDELRYIARADRPDLIDANRVKYTPAERQLLDEMYEWLILKYVRSGSVPGARAVKAEAPAPEAAGNRREAAGAGNQAPGRRRSMYGDTERIEKKTLRRIQGQLAIDMMMMTCGRDAEEDHQDEEDYVLDQFLTACRNSIAYRDCTMEQCIELWESAMQEDRRLFERGKLMTAMDMGVICMRCLMLAIANAPDDQSMTRETIIAGACEYMDAFQLMYRAEELQRELARWLKWYMVDKKVPASALSLLRENRESLADAYSMYVEQSQAEIEQRRNEIARQVELLHANDRAQYRKEQHSKTLQQIREFTCIENGAPLGWLCMIKYGMTFTDEQMHFFIDGMIQKLKAIGLEPFATDKVDRSFDGGEAGAEAMLDLSGQRLETGERYRLVQLGWKYQGETVVLPKAERIAEGRGGN
ncbi:MAG: hypothetical protein ACI4O7_02540 [Aristaeellaceae bacterium]